MLLVTGELLSELAEQPRVLRVLVQVSQVALLVLVSVLTVRVHVSVLPLGKAKPAAEAHGVFNKGQINLQQRGHHRPGAQTTL